MQLAIQLLDRLVNQRVRTVLVHDLAQEFGGRGGGDVDGLAAHLGQGLGFRLEARLVDADWYKGEWTTLRIYARLADEARRDGD